jgi:hypothetical protein
MSPFFEPTNGADAAADFDEATAQAMIDAAVSFRQAEKNTPPVCTLNSPSNAASYIFLCATGLHNEPANAPQLRLLPKGAEELSA